MFKEISLKKLSFGKILSMGWKIYKSQFVTIVAIILISSLPTILAQFNIGKMSKGTFSPGYFLLAIIGILTSILGALALCYVVDATVNETEISFREAFNKALPIWGSSIWTSILCALIIIGLCFLLIIPGIIWSVYYIFAIYVVALKGLTGKAALNYSKGLVVGRWWEVFFVNLGIGLLTGIIGFVIVFVPNLFTVGAPGQGPNSFMLAITTAIYSIIYAFYYVAAIVYFLNLDNQKNIRTNNQVIVEAQPPVAD